MSYWLALWCPPSNEPSPAEPPTASAQAVALAGWALQFTPKVALLEEAAVLEAGASLRLFGGPAALRRRIASHARQLGCQRMAWAPTSLGALALARSMRPDGFAEPIADLLDRLPLGALSAVSAQEAVLARLGCRTLGQVRALPRAGLSRRFGRALLETMDGAYGLTPESHVWLELPETFEAELELPGRVENADALMFGAQRLLLQMSGWLAARHAGVSTFVLAWQHDFHRRAAGPGGELRVRTAHPTRHTEHLRRLLQEQLSRVALAAPVGALRLRAEEVELMPELSRGLWPQRELENGASDAAASAVQIDELLERLGARLGAERVLRPALHADHRLEAMQSWTPALAAAAAKAPASGRPAKKKAAGMPDPKPRRAAAEPDPQPSWVLPEPVPLPVRGDRPHWLGPLEIVAGPQRVEVGWWAQAAADAHAASTLRVQRDYYVAHGARAGLLWIYSERPLQDLQGATEASWFLHGFFA